MSRKSSQKKSANRTELNQPATEPVSLFPADRRRGYAILGAAFVFTLLTYILHLDKVVGLMSDDGWYVLLAKSLATGQGYQLINSPSAGILPIYPPLFPFLLSIAWRIWPQFPENIILLKWVSIAAMMISGWLVYVHFVLDRKTGRNFGAALGLATATAPVLVFTATGTVMSECVYLCLQIGTVIAAERTVRAGERGSWKFWTTLGEKRFWNGWQYAILAAALASGSFLTRSIGVVVIGAVAVYLIYSRMFPLAAVFVLATAVMTGPWMIYQQTHMATAAQRAEQNNYIVKDYGAQMQDVQGDQPRSNRFLEHLYFNASFYLEHHTGAMVIDPWFRAAEPAVGRGRTQGKAIISLLLFLISMIGLYRAIRNGLTSGDLIFVFSIGICIIWVFFSVRLIFPLAPWVFYYLGLGVRSIIGGLRFTRRKAPAAVGWASAAVWAIVLINTFSNADYILGNLGLVGERPVWERNYQENIEAMDWVDRNLPKDAILASSNPSLLYLFTGRKTIGNARPATRWELWKEMGVRYGVWLRYAEIIDPTPNEKRFHIPYQSERLKLRVLDFGDPATRPDWVPDKPAN